MSMMRITNAILGNENSVLTVSAYLNGEYGQHGVYAGVPCIVNRGGIDEILEFNLSKDEQAKMQSSCDGLRKLCKVLDMPSKPRTDRTILMKGVIIMDQNLELLNDVYENAEMGRDTIKS